MKGGRHSAGPGAHGCFLVQERSDKERWQHLADLADFALAMKDTLTNINNQSFNNFMLRIGKASRLAHSCRAPPSAGGSANRGGWGLETPEAFGLGRVILTELEETLPVFRLMMELKVR